MSNHPALSKHSQRTEQCLHRFVYQTAGWDYTPCTLSQKNSRNISKLNSPKSSFFTHLWQFHPRWNYSNNLHRCLHDMATRSLGCSGYTGSIRTFSTKKTHERKDVNRQSNAYWNNNGTSPFLKSKSTINGNFIYSYVSLPGGYPKILSRVHSLQVLHCFSPSRAYRPQCLRPLADRVDSLHRPLIYIYI